MNNVLQGKVALVTGGGSGIGQAAARLFARQGASVVVADIESTGGAETVRVIEKEGGQAIFVKTDVSRDAAVAALVEQAITSFSGLDYAFNNAGVTGRGGLIAEASEEAWDRVLEVNLKGIWLCLKYELRYMAAQGKGSIVNTSSIGGLLGFAGNAAYIASKHAIIGLTKAAALEYGPRGIRVNAICPGTIRTPLLEPLIAMNPDSLKNMAARIPMGRVGTPLDIAETVVWLCSGAAYVNGHILVVDGGYVCGDFPPPK
jgi:NAD(P)-dependent dehydrogenase (short-subunit alcohol dehydrogenase family)